MIIWVVVDMYGKFVAAHIKVTDAQRDIDNDDRSASPRGLHMFARDLMK